MEQIAIKDNYTIKIIEKREYMNEYMKKYRKNNKKAWDSEKIKCDICNCEYTKSNKSHHYKSKRHELAELRRKMDDMKKLIS